MKILTVSYKIIFFSYLRIDMFAKGGQYHPRVRAGGSEVWGSSVTCPLNDCAVWKGFKGLNHRYLFSFNAIAPLLRQPGCPSPLRAQKTKYGGDEVPFHPSLEPAVLVFLLSLLLDGLRSLILILQCPRTLCQSSSSPASCRQSAKHNFLAGSHC